MTNRKGVTDIILLIGTVVIVAIIIGLGASKLVLPLIKTTPRYTVEEARLAINTLYAAPDDMEHKFVVENRAKNCYTKFWIENSKFNEEIWCKGEPTIIDYMLSPLGSVISATNFEKKESSSGGSYTSGTCKPPSAVRIPQAGLASTIGYNEDNKWKSGEGSSQTIKMTKSYDNFARTCKVGVTK